MENYYDVTAIIIRDVADFWKATFPTTLLVYEDAEKVDLDKVTSPFGRVEVNIEGEYQQSLDKAPIEQLTGAVVFQIFFKLGGGGRKATEMLDKVRKHFGFLTLAPDIHFEAPFPGVRVEQAGWASRESRIPFSFWK